VVQPPVCTGFVEDSGDPDAGACVAHIAVGVGSGAPVGTCVRILFGLRVKVTDLSEIRGGEFDKVVFEKVIYIGVVVDVLGGEDCAFVCDIAASC
jgi:hypothetical protein